MQHPEALHSPAGTGQPPRPLKLRRRALAVQGKGRHQAVSLKVPQQAPSQEGLEGPGRESKMGNFPFGMEGTAAEQNS